MSLMIAKFKTQVALGLDMALGLPPYEILCTSLSYSDGTLTCKRGDKSSTHYEVYHFEVIPVEKE